MMHGGWLERAIDSALSVISPRRLVVRTHLRRMDNDAEYRDTFMLGMRLRGYRGAEKRKTRTPFGDATRSADAELLRDLPTLRNRSRELNRDDAVGTGITDTFVRNIVGTGIVAQATSGDPDKDRRIERVWKNRCDNLFPVDGLLQEEAQRLLINKMLEDGEILVHAAYDDDGRLFFEIIEGDRIVPPRSHKPSKGHEIRDGVERDSRSVIVGYWVLKGHPGDNIVPGKFGEMSEMLRLPAEDCCHFKVVERPGQSRGIPLLHAVMQDLRDLDLLMVASIKRVQIAALLAAFIKTGPGMGIPDTVEVTARKEGYILDQALEPGMMWQLGEGEEIQTLVPNFPTPELEPFIILIARRIGAALGVTWQMILKDFGKANYSSARTDLLESRPTFTILQHFFSRKCLDWQWNLVMEDARLHGDALLAGVSAEESLGARWTPNGWKWVDPVKEANAARIELEMGTTTLRDIAASKGNDWEEIQDQRLLEEKREAEKRGEMGLRVSSKESDAATGRAMENIARGVRSGVPVAISEARAALGLESDVPEGKLLRFNDQDVLQYHIELGILLVDEVRTVLGLKALGKAKGGHERVRKTGVEVLRPGHREGEDGDGDEEEPDGEDNGDGDEGRNAFSGVSGSHVGGNGKDND